MEFHDKSSAPDRACDNARPSACPVAACSDTEVAAKRRNPRAQDRDWWFEEKRSRKHRRCLWPLGSQPGGYFISFALSSHAFTAGQYRLFPHSFCFCGNPVCLASSSCSTL